MCHLLDMPRSSFKSPPLCIPGIRYQYQIPLGASRSTLYNHSNSISTLTYCMQYAQKKKLQILPARPNLANQYYRGTECIRKQNVWPGNLMQVIYLAPQLIHTSMYKMYNVLAIILLQVPFISATDCISGMIEYGMTHTSNRQYVFNLVNLVKFS